MPAGACPGIGLRKRQTAPRQGRRIISCRWRVLPAALVLSGLAMMSFSVHLARWPAALRGLRVAPVGHLVQRRQAALVVEGRDYPSGHHASPAGDRDVIAQQRSSRRHFPGRPCMGWRGSCRNSDFRGSPYIQASRGLRLCSEARGWGRRLFHWRRRAAKATPQGGAFLRFGTDKGAEGGRPLDERCIRGWSCHR